MSQAKGVAHFGRPSAAAPRYTFPPPFTRVSYDEKIEPLLPEQSDPKTWIAQLTEPLSRAG